MKTIYTSIEKIKNQSFYNVNITKEKYNINDEILKNQKLIYSKNKKDQIFRNIIKQLNLN